MGVLMSISLMQPKLPTYEELAPYFRRIDSSKMYSNFGPLNELLISRLANYFEVDESEIHTVSNATQGLIGTIELLSEGLDAIWDIPSWTFAASAIALKQARAVGTFCDVDSNWRVIPSAGSDRFIDVLPFGESLRKSTPSLDNSVKIIDGAASFDALKGVGKLLDENSYLVISMHATKLIAGGEGGIVISKNPLWADRFKSWTNYGFEGTRISKNLGTNAKISEYTAAIALASLDQWEEIRGKILDNSKIAISISKDRGFSVNSSMQHGFATPYWILDCKDSNQKMRVINELTKLSIPTRNWWESGCHEMPAFSDFKRNSLEETEKIASRTVGLPFHYFLKDKDFEAIDSALQKIS
jgi:dTDP-4-amino-4,6-dideoxygalactose transaminase